VCVCVCVCVGAVTRYVLVSSNRSLPLASTLIAGAVVSWVCELNLLLCVTFCLIECLQVSALGLL
jgi:hypothetical protein